MPGSDIKTHLKSRLCAILTKRGAVLELEIDGPPTAAQKGRVPAGRNTDTAACMRHPVSFVGAEMVTGLGLWLWSSPCDGLATRMDLPTTTRRSSRESEVSTTPSKLKSTCVSHCSDAFPNVRYAVEMYRSVS